MVPVRLEVGYPVASCKSNAGVASVSPKLNVIPPIAILELDNLSLAIEPANWALVMVPVRSDVAKPPLNVVAVTIPAIIPAALIVVAEPTTNEVVISTSFGSPIWIWFPDPAVSISFDVPTTDKVSESKSILRAPPVSAWKSKSWAVTSVSI